MPLAVSIDNMASEVRRELAFRDRIYPRWVSQGKIRADTAAMQIDRMAAILEALEELKLARQFKTALDQSPFALNTIEGDPVRRAIDAWDAPREAPLTTGTHST